MSTQSNDYQESDDVEEFAKMDGCFAVIIIVAAITMAAIITITYFI